MDDDPTVLHQLPTITGADLSEVPEPLLRALYGSFQLEVRYRRDEHTVTIRATVREERIPAIQATTANRPDTGPRPTPDARMFVAPPTGSQKQPSSAPGPPPTAPTPATTFPGRQVVLEAHRPLPPRRNAELLAKA